MNNVTTYEAKAPQISLITNTTVWKKDLVQ